MYINTSFCQRHKNKSNFNFDLFSNVNKKISFPTTLIIKIIKKNNKNISFNEFFTIRKYSWRKY